jgi:hypothetical protein
MAWQTNRQNPNNSSTGYWDSAMSRTTYGSGAQSLWWKESTRTFNPNKRYIFITEVRFFSNYRGGSLVNEKWLNMITPWDNFLYARVDSNIFEDKTPSTGSTRNIYHITSPTYSISATDIVQYESTYDGFGNDGSDVFAGAEIESFNLVETDWYFQGYAVCDDVKCEGWVYDDDDDKFTHRIYRMGVVIGINLSAGGSGYPDNGQGPDWIIDNGLGTASVNGGFGFGLSLTFSVSGGAVTSVSIHPDNDKKGQYYLPSNTVGISGGVSLAPVEITSISTVGNISPNKPIGGHSGSNYIARYINYPTFNLQLDVEVSADDRSYVSLYLMDELPDDTVYPDPVGFQNDINQRISDGSAQFIGNIDSDATFNYYDLVGDKFLVIVSNYFLASSSSIISISNISIDGAYQEDDNNEQFLFTNSDTYSEPTELCIIGGSVDATYSVVVVGPETLHELVGTPSNTFAGATGFPGFFSNLYGDVINLNYLYSKVGNGKFKSGVWENGVWNSGWRVDDGVYEFDDVKIALLMRTTNTKWRIEITGTKESVSNFEIGDRVSIGNIVGIDINEKRKLMKNYFTVLSKGNTTMIVDFNNSFPLRRIEKDSENHKIKISKNVWLNGGFLNGYFEGIWNSGLFKGFPYITEIYNTHWIDGKYDGGHFYGEYPEYSYVDTYWWSETAPNTLGLTFGATAHGLVLGDLVSIDKDDKLLNPQYDGDAEVIAVVDDYMVVVNKSFGASSTLEGGVIKRRTGTAVIQNFEFYDNNVAPRTTLETSNLESIYKYNSWVDVEYLDESASNLGRKQIIYDPLWGEYVQNNLYGHITKDVLDSVSSFRNSHDLNKTIYSLGTKYSIYEDFIGDSSEFNEPFGSNNQGLDNFYNNGWTNSSQFITYDYVAPTQSGNLKISRQDSTESLEIEISQASLGIFNLDNTNVTIDKNRYSIIEFDLNSFLATTDEWIPPFPSLYLLNTISLPGGTDPAFPDQEYVFHTRTESVRKYEYFYNRRGLDILLLNGTGITASFDNVKIYEIDKIPFFKYVTDDYVNKGVQVPYQGTAPFIDYEDNEFSFIDNINIGLDSLSTQQSYNDPNDDDDDDDGVFGIFSNDERFGG